MFRLSVPVLAACLIFQVPATQGAAAAGNPELVPLNELIAQNRYADAYSLSQDLLDEWEGDPEFDFLYGMAALETGNSNEAVFAFERLVRTYPNQQRVKLELARAFYEQNNLSASRTLFEEVLATNPVEAVRTNIDTFLTAIDERENSLGSKFSWYLSSNIGNDSNINSATELGVISTPIGDIELGAGGQSISDTFVDLAGGMNFVKPLSKTSSINVNASYSRHDNADSNSFDLDVLAADFNYARVFDNTRLSSGVRTQLVDLDGATFQKSASLIGAVQRSPGNGWSQWATAAYTSVRYDTGVNPNADLRDVDQLLVSGVLGKSMGRFNHTVSVYFGDEDARVTFGENNAQQFYGLAFSEQFLLKQGHIPYFRVSVHKSENKAAAPIFNIVREDDTFSTSLGYIWSATPHINVTTDVTYTENDSNLDLFSYDRVKYQTGLRYQF